MTRTANLPSNNEAWGFFGTVRHHAEPSEAWALAMTAVSEATTCPEFAVRDFLDSRDGRYFADSVADALFRGDDLKTAIEAAVERWMSWTIDRRTEREHGIPRGLPYLTGWVAHYEILGEAEGEIGA
jgi:hypothetical protein